MFFDYDFFVKICYLWGSLKGSFYLFLLYKLIKSILYARKLKANAMKRKLDNDEEVKRVLIFVKQNLNLPKEDKLKILNADATELSSFIRSFFIKFK